VGSGLILLVIVGAWLAVLVPVALRSQESNAQSTVEAFHDAMRVLSRREGVAVTAPASPDLQSASPRGHSAASRRRRVLLVLLAMALLSLVGGVTGPRWLLGVHLGADALVLGYLGHLRHTTVLRREREMRQRRRRESPAVLEPRRVHEEPAPASATVRAVARTGARTGDAAAVVAAARRAQARGAAADAAVRARSRIAGVPDQMPSRAAVGTALYALPVAALEDAVVEPARGAQGAAWSPVPVPLPAYLTAPVAPRRAPAASRSGDEGERYDETVERKWAVND